MTTKEQVERIIRSNVSSKIHFFQLLYLVTLLPLWIWIVVYYLNDILSPVYQNDPQPYSTINIVARLVPISVAACNAYIFIRQLRRLLVKYRTLYVYYNTSLVMNYAFLMDMPGAAAVSDMCSKKEVHDKKLQMLIRTINEMRTSAGILAIFGRENPGLIGEFFDYINITSLPRTEIVQIMRRMLHLSVDLKFLTFDWIIFPIVTVSAFWYWAFNLGLLLVGYDSPHTSLSCALLTVFMSGMFVISLLPLLSAEVSNATLESRLITIAERYPDGLSILSEPRGMCNLLNNKV